MSAPWHLIDGYLDGLLSEAELEELKAWAGHDREHLKTLVRAAYDHSALAMIPRLGEARVSSPPVQAGLPKLAPAESQFSTAGTEARTGGAAFADQLATSAASPRALGKHTRWAWTAIAAAAACVALIIGLSRLGSQPESSDPRLQEIHGFGLTIERDGHSREANVGAALRRGDVLRVPVDGRAVLTYGRQATRLEVRENTVLQIQSSDSGKRLHVLAGAIVLDVVKQPRGKPLTVLTAQTEVRVIGTRLTVMAGARTTRVGVSEGRVQLISPASKAPLDVRAGHLAIAQTDGTVFVDTFVPPAGIVFTSGESFASVPAEPATAMPGSPAGVLSAPPTGTGAILREYWFDVRGSGLSNLTAHPAFPNSPSGRDYPRGLETFEGGPSHDLYGARWRGYLHAPVAGNYTFWISSDDTSELYLSPDDQPHHRKLLCHVPGFTWLREWTRFAEQESSLVHLEAGQRYYLEILHKESGGGDHVAVAWQLPGREAEVIGGAHLAPFPAVTAAALEGAAIRE